jgi:predicted NACHT family NTPase
MARQAFQASPTGVEQAKASLARRGWTQEYLAACAGCARQTVVRFFKPAPIDRKLFTEICSLLDLDWEAASNFNSKQRDDSEELGINILVDELRKIGHTDIETKCSNIRVLDMEWPIELEAIYINVNRLEKIAGNMRLGIPDLLRGKKLEDFDRFGLGNITQQLPAIDAVEANAKLMVLGKAGSGKSTFLKHLALQCNRGEFQAERVPIFVDLKNFSEYQGVQTLLEYISLCFSNYEEKQAIQSTEKILLHGRALILLDGLDEVHAENRNSLFIQLRSFINRFYSNHFVITCRLAYTEYHFDNFAEVEIADFNTLQIASFIKKWFKIKGDSSKAERMLWKLNDRQPVMELTTNPLLLTLLCLIFGDSSDFPNNRSELYEEGLAIMLKKWDAKRDIYRHQIYKKLSLKRKEDLLSQLAFDTFDRGEYFFKQSTVERYITKYIRNIPGTATDEEALQLDSEVVLRSIEAQHGLLVERARGIYSFSHLTFHEYFTAKRIVDSSIAQGNEGFLRLAKNVVNKRWREVFFLVVEMLPDASICLLTIKREIDGLLAGDQKLQEYLVWLEEKCRSIDDRASISVYSSYLYLDCTIDLVLDFFPTPSLDKSSCFNFDRLLVNSYCGSISISKSNIISISSILFSLDLAIKEYQQLKYITPLIDELKNLKQYFHSISGKESDSTKWKDEIYYWQQKLRAAMIKYRNIGHDWKFTKQQNESLKKYYFANMILKDCLESECYIDLDTRKYITDTFCRPLHLIPSRS